MTTLYDVLAPAYDPVFQSIYQPFRERAFESLPHLPGACVLDLACGTGQNFPLLAERIGARGRIIGVDISSGMLSRARRRASKLEMGKITLARTNGTQLTQEWLEVETGHTSVDVIVCTYGFTAMREWQAAFRASWKLLAPGGHYLIHDIDGQRRNLHTRLVEWATRCDFSQKVWESLEQHSSDFRMDYLEPSAHLFGGRLFVAHGVKAPVQPPNPCPS